MWALSSSADLSLALAVPKTITGKNSSPKMSPKKTLKGFLSVFQHLQEMQRTVFWQSFPNFLESEKSKNVQKNCGMFTFLRSVKLAWVKWTWNWLSVTDYLRMPRKFKNLIALPRFCGPASQTRANFWPRNDWRGIASFFSVKRLMTNAKPSFQLHEQCNQSGK